MAGPVVAARFKVVLPADIPQGQHDLRVISKWGVSNPRVFVVGDLTEVLEVEPNNDVPEAQRVELNTTINGVIGTATDVDYFVFRGHKGQKVVAACAASSIDSRLLAALELYGPGGALLAANRLYQGTDAVFSLTLPADDDYHVRLSSFTYTQGGPDHFYRLTLTTAPWIDAVFPPVVEPGKPAQVTVYGRNLPGGRAPSTPEPAAGVDGPVLETLSVTLTAPKASEQLAYTGHVAPPSSALDGFTYRLRNAAGWSNPYLLTYATAPVVLDNGHNETPQTAQQVPVPCEIAGRIEKKGDRDWYAFTAHKGDVYSIEAFGDRLGSPLNLYLRLLRADTNQVLADLDDSTEILSPTQFFTRTEDPPRYRFVAPADGRYLLLIGSQEASVQAGPRQLYRVRIGPERPDFRLVVMPPATNLPEACTVGAGGRQYWTVFAWRLDGFAGDITLTAAGLPPGVTCPPQTLGAGQRQGVLVVSAADDAEPWAGTITVRGTATIQGRTVVREARPGTITWPMPQQNAPAIARLDRNLVLAVRERPPYRLTAGLEKITAVSGEKVTVPVQVERLWPEFKSALQVTVLNLPTQGPKVAPLTLPAGKDTGSIPITLGSQVPPGVYTLVLRGQGTVPFHKDPAAKQKPNVSAVQPSTPVALHVLPKQVARVKVSPASLSVPRGKEAVVLVQVERLFDYAGPLQVQLVVPANIKGVMAAEATIPAGQGEVRLVVRVADDAAPGNRSGLILRVTATIEGKELTQEAKLNVAVVK